MGGMGWWDMVLWLGGFGGWMNGEVWRALGRGVMWIVRCGCERRLWELKVEGRLVDGRYEMERRVFHGTMLT